MASVRGRYLGGQSVLLQGATVGDIMVQIARDHQRFASDVVVLPVGSGEVLAPDRIPPPEVAIVLKKEEALLDVEECKINVTLYAAAGDTPGVVRALAMLRNAAPYNSWPENTLSRAARDADQEKTVRTLIRAGLTGSGAVATACDRGNEGALQRLIRAGAKVNGVDNWSKQSVLMNTSQFGRKEEVKMLLAAQADIHHTDRHGANALMFACERDRQENVRILVDAGADVNYVDRYGRSTLGHAISHKGSVDILLAAKADTNHVDEKGGSALIHAGNCWDKGVTEMLLAAQADINHADQRGHSALAEASIYGRREVVEILLAAQADINRVDQNGRSALTLASQDGHKEVVGILLAAGAVCV
eukprot:GEMP01043806.1.p1 GENE.GEMP01043806.1~~GEMP01043806.1.p1  ORF type:complete len:361 (+),score=96.03 GEMP01043806.1:243-1325(+)